MASRRELAHGGDLSIPITADGPWCPVCGINLSPADLQAEDADYYCPYCTTRKKPRGGGLRAMSGGSV